ncbi:hypothetical protein [Bacillus xiapuensis]|uniref:Uncharacterized protein n=1 Tax=Bacillus xiapuensis TaxID=2014075 RepID=A0ABU6N8E9_9BACI|nr:hypothetical protein [Bacillus xiapuensis]
MQTYSNFHVFLEKLIDYAGLFPPAMLPLGQAVQNYAEYIDSDDAWMLGPFVLPVAKLNEIPNYRALFSEKKPLKLSVVGRRSNSVKECLVQFREDLEQMVAFKNHHRDWCGIEGLELPMPAEQPTTVLLKELAIGAERVGMKVFCEVGISDGTLWKEQWDQTVDAIASFNSSNPIKLGIKLRTGGVKASMFPSKEKVAYGIRSCQVRKLPMKFTAGLHHPIRMYREEVGTKMHGFLNIFLAGMLANYLNLNEKQIEAVLSEEDPQLFALHHDYLAWKDMKIPAQAIKELRRDGLCSFGSCSFAEPRDEFFELIKQQEVYK